MTSSDKVAGDLKRSKEELETLLRMMGYEARVEAFDDNGEEVLLHIESPDAGRLIGRGAANLDALQYILNRIMYDRDSEALHCIVDIERYRERKKDRLMKEAYEAADKVERTGKPVRFAPMSAGDRRIIHQALKDRDGIDTYSEKSREEGRKRVVVCLTNVEGAEEEPEQPEPEEAEAVETEEVDGNKTE